MPVQPGAVALTTPDRVELVSQHAVQLDVEHRQLQKGAVWDDFAKDGCEIWD
jgi:hypothetical protein